MNQRLIWLALSVAPTFGLSLATTCVAAQPNAAARIDALRFSLDKSVAYCRECLEGIDFKSLAQTADGLRTLSAVLAAKSQDEAWQRAAAELSQAVDALRSAARAADRDRTGEALARVEQAAAAASRLQPAGEPQTAPAGSNLRELMMLLENVRGQAKVALLTGEAANAKRAALVLAELGPVLTNTRRGEDWEIMSHDFTQAALAAAASPEEDTLKLKPLFKTMSQACDHCHDSR
jgi:hypothetical protein